MVNLRQWLAQSGLTVERLAKLIEPEYTPERKIHLYHCDHRGLPLALMGSEGSIVWQAEYNEWGNQLNENNPHNITQNIRLPGQQYDEESGLHYNRHRYYELLQGRYITQDPIGLRGGWNSYMYPLNPVKEVDPLGLQGIGSFGKGYTDYCSAMSSAVTRLSPDDAETVRYNMETMHNAYNPLSEFVFGVSVGAPLASVSALEVGPLTLMSTVDRGAACVNDVANGVIVERETDPKNITLTCVKAFLNKNSSFIQRKSSDLLIDILSSYSQKQ